MGFDKRLLLVDDGTTASNIAIRTYHFAHFYGYRHPFSQHVAHKIEIGILFTLLAKESVDHDTIHIILGQSTLMLISYCATKSLRQIWMTHRPFHYPSQNFARLFRGKAESRSQRQRFFEREVGQVNALADVEWGALRIANQVAGRR